MEITVEQLIHALQNPAIDPKWTVYINDDLVEGMSFEGANDWEEYHPTELSILMNARTMKIQPFSAESRKLQQDRNDSAVVKKFFESRRKEGKRS